MATIVIGAVIEGLMKWKGNPAEAEEVLLGEVRSSGHGVMAEQLVHFEHFKPKVLHHDV